MKVLIPGHRYLLDHLDGDGKTLVDFVSREPHETREGTVNQEVLRMLIDRVLFLDAEKPWERNAEIITCLRKALLLHELRALERHVDKGEIAPEKIAVGEDGHFRFQTNG